MKNLKLIIAIVFMLACSKSYAQLEKGNYLIGGSAGLDLEFVDIGGNNIALFLTPGVLRLVTDDLAIGGVLGVTYRENGIFSATSVSIVPVGRFYFPVANRNFAFYTNAQAGLEILNVNTDGDSDSEAAFAFGFGPGVALFVSDNVSIDTGISFRRVGGNIDQSNINLNIGLQVFLTRKEKE